MDHEERRVFLYYGACPDCRVRHEYRTLTAAKFGDTLPGYCIACRHNHHRIVRIRLLFRYSLMLMSRDVPQYGYSLGCHAPQYTQRKSLDT
jgi:hypothetical protein